MWERVSEGMIRLSTGWVTLAMVIAFLVFAALVLPGVSAQSSAEAGGAGSPDLSLFYTPQRLYDMAEAYGTEGRTAYVRARWTFDLVWPLVYAAFLGATISWLYGRAFQGESRWRRANLVPLLGALLDYGENACTSLLMARYPARTPVVAVLAPLFTLLKWVALGASFVLLLLGVGFAVYAWRRRAGAR